MTDNPRISGIDWQGLRKGDLVPHDHVKEFFFSIFPDEEWNDFSMVRVIDKLMKLRETINRPLVIKSINKDKSLQVLTDKEAVDYSAQQANAGIKKHRNDILFNVPKKLDHKHLLFLMDLLHIQFSSPSLHMIC